MLPDISNKYLPWRKAEPFGAGRRISFLNVIKCQVSGPHNSSEVISTNIKAPPTPLWTLHRNDSISFFFYSVQRTIFVSFDWQYFCKRVSW